MTADGVVLPSAEVFSEGVGESEGIAILDEDSAYYLANTAGNLNSTLGTLIDVLAQVKIGLDKAVEALGKAQSALQTHDTSGFLIAATAGVPSPPLAAADIAGIGTVSAEITNAATQIETLKGDLETLQGELK